MSVAPLAALRDKARTNELTLGVPGSAAAVASHTVPFRTQPYAARQILWLNERYCGEAGIDVRNEAERNRLCEQLLDEFGVGTPDDDRPAYLFGNQEGRTLLADRYGSTAGTLQGGSGRCGSSDGLNAKGVGRTPLVSERADREHNHGFVSFTEAVREVVWSELLERELPHGAVPIIAMIGTGSTFRFYDDAGEEPCVILVRPDFARPALFERSIYFGTAGFEGSDQFEDAQRVKSAFEIVNGTAAEADLFGSSADHPSPMLLRIAEQIGWARAKRMWLGQFLTSNVTTSGRIVDFGAFRSVWSWEAAVGRPNQVFGREAEALAAAHQSLSFYRFKHTGRGGRPIGMDVLEPRYEAAIRAAFRAACETFVLGPGSVAADDAVSVLADYYDKQQETSVQLGSRDRTCLRRPWLGDVWAKPGQATGRVSDLERSTAADLQQALRRHASLTGQDEAPVTDHAAQSLRNRPLLQLEYAMPIARRFARQVFSQGTVGDAAMVQDAIDTVVLSENAVLGSYKQSKEVR